MRDGKKEMKLGKLLTGSTRSKTVKIAIVAVATVGGISLVSSSVFASLNATANNTEVQSINGGKLTIALSSTGNGIGNTGSGILNMGNFQPGDTQYRLVDLNQNSGSSAVAADPLSTRIDVRNSSTDAHSALNSVLEIGIDECTSGTWSYVANAPVCAGGTVVHVLSTSPGGSLQSAIAATSQGWTSDYLSSAQLANEANVAFDTAPTLDATSGIDANAMSIHYLDSTTTPNLVPPHIHLTNIGAGQTAHLLVKFYIPANYYEVTSNGTPSHRLSDIVSSSSYSTIQDKTANLTFTFSENQLAGSTTTN